MMKVKKFKNLWTMGLILFGSLLAIFYIIKIFFPEFIVGVAEIPSIVSIGKFIDSNIVVHHIFNIIIGYLGGYIYCCACCRKRYLNWKNNLILLFCIVALRVFAIIMPMQYSAMNYVIFILCPFLMCVFDKTLTDKLFISTCVCFCVDIVTQVFSAQIRDLFLYATHINSATMIILLIDIWICRFLLYFFFNNKTNENTETEEAE